MSDYEDMTVAQLKELLKEAGLPVSGKKADLIARLEEGADEPAPVEEESAEEEEADDDADDEEKQTKAWKRFNETQWGGFKGLLIGWFALTALAELYVMWLA